MMNILERVQPEMKHGFPLPDTETQALTRTLIKRQERSGTFCSNNLHHFTQILHLN